MGFLNVAFLRQFVDVKCLNAGVFREEYPDGVIREIDQENEVVQSRTEAQVRFLIFVFLFEFEDVKCL